MKLNKQLITSYRELMNMDKAEFKELLSKGLIQCNNESNLEKNIQNFLFAVSLFKTYYRNLEENELSVVFNALDSGLFNVGPEAYLKAFNKINNTQYLMTDPKISQFLDRIGYEMYLEVASFEILQERREFTKIYFNMNVYHLL